MQTYDSNRKPDEVYPHMAIRPYILTKEDNTQEFHMQCSCYVRKKFCKHWYVSSLVSHLSSPERIKTQEIIQWMNKVRVEAYLLLTLGLKSDMWIKDLNQQSEQDRLRGLLHPKGN